MGDRRPHRLLRELARERIGHRDREPRPSRARARAVGRCGRHRSARSVSASRTRKGSSASWAREYERRARLRLGGGNPRRARDGLRRRRAHRSGAHRGVPRADRVARRRRPGAPLGDRDQPGCARDRGHPRCGATRRARARTPARDPDPGEGQPGHRRCDAHHGRIPRAGGSAAPARRTGRRTAARRRRRVARQGQHVGVGQLPLDARVQRLERARRPVPEPVRPRPQRVWIFIGIRASRSRRTSARWPSARRPTGRSSARPRSPGSSGSSRRSASSRPRASCRSPTRRTPRARWRARSRDAAAVLAAIADAPGGRSRGHPTPCDGARIGVARNMAGFHEEVDALFEEALDALRDGRRGRRRSRRRAERERARRARVGGAALRVQGRRRGLPGDGRRRCAPHARRADRLQRGASRRGAPVLRAGSVREGGGEGPAQRTPPTSRRSPRRLGSHAKRDSTPRSPPRARTRSWRRRGPQRG